MNRGHKNGRGRRFSCLCLAIMLLLAAVCTDIYASAGFELPPETELVGETSVMSGETGASVEDAESLETEEIAEPAAELPGEEILPEETAAPEDSAEDESGNVPEETPEAEPVPAVIDAPEDLESLVQTQEGLERAIEEGLITFETPDEGIAAASTKAGSRAEIVQIAKKQVGIKGRPNKFTYWYGAIQGYSNPYAYAWCQVFASWCGYKAGVSVPREASCYYAGLWFMERGLWRSRNSGYKPKAGDFIYFDWGANGGWDHVGIVNYVSGGRVYTIEGNTGDMVKASKSYSLKSKEIIGYGTPKYVGGGRQNNPPQGCFDEVLPEKGTYVVRFRGWSFDWDDPDKTVKIRICVGGDADSGVPAYEVPADYYRPDVDNAYPGCGEYHGFDATIDVPVNRTKKQTVYVYAVDAGGMDDVLLGSRTLKKDKTIKEDVSEHQSGGVIPDTSREFRKPEATPTPTPKPITVGTVKKPKLKQTAYDRLQISWKAVNGADSYEVQCAADAKFKKPSVVTAKKKKATVKVPCGTMTYFRIRACRKVNGKKYYGSFSAVVKGKTSLGKAKLTSCVSKKKKKIRIITGRVDGADSYQAVVSRKADFSKPKYVSAKSGTKTITVKKSKKYYYVKVRARRKVSGSYVYGPYSAVKKIKVK